MDIENLLRKNIIRMSPIELHFFGEGKQLVYYLKTEKNKYINKDVICFLRSKPGEIHKFALEYIEDVRKLQYQDIDERGSK